MCALAYEICQICHCFALSRELLQAGVEMYEFMIGIHLTEYEMGSKGSKQKLDRVGKNVVATTAAPTMKWKIAM